MGSKQWGQAPAFRKIKAKGRLLSSITAATDSGTCENRSKWLARMQAGLSRLMVYSVPTWYQSNDKPWDINTLIQVSDKFYDIEEEMLIVTTEFQLSAKKMTTEITVANSDTFTLGSGDVAKIKDQNLDV